MNTNNFIKFYEELDNDDKLPANLRFDTHRSRGRVSKKLSEQEAQFVRAQDDSTSSFKFTYKPARFEEWWLLSSLGDFYEHQWISDVLRRVKGGKEASVYLCRAGQAADSDLVAAKVYRPRSLRNLKNDGQYRTGRPDLDVEGNIVLDHGAQNAMAKRSSIGEIMRHQSWIAYEFTTLELLYESGADVPKPYAMENNAILMDFIGDFANPAPTLNTVSLTRDEARTIFERVLRNVDIMLAHDRIHGDLSAYNILYWDGDITLIDFPQVVIPESNAASWSIFLRDMTRVCQYFSLQGVNCDANKIASDLWTSHGHRIVKEVHPIHLDPDKPEDRKLWEKQG